MVVPLHVSQGILAAKAQKKRTMLVTALSAAAMSRTITHHIVSINTQTLSHYINKRLLRLRWFLLTFSHSSSTFDRATHAITLPSRPHYKRSEKNYKPKQTHTKKYTKEKAHLFRLETWICSILLGEQRKTSPVFPCFFRTLRAVSKSLLVELSCCCLRPAPCLFISLRTDRKGEKVSVYSLFVCGLSVVALIRCLLRGTLTVCEINNTVSG